MAVALRLMRFGKKHYPTYRLVAVDKRKKRDGAYIESVGSYNPMRDPVELVINDERLEYWLKTGAQVSEGAQKLITYRKNLSDPAYLEKKKKLEEKKKADREAAMKAKEAEAQAAAAPQEEAPAEAPEPSQEEAPVQSPEAAQEDAPKKE